MKYLDPSRRELLKTLAGAAAILPASGLIAQTKKGAGRPRRIDGLGNSLCRLPSS
jgi:hypothetical protein